MTTKEQFLDKHNSLSPDNLKADLEMLASFMVEKPNLFKGNDWPIEKIRRPFIFWLTSLSNSQKQEMSE